MSGEEWVGRVIDQRYVVESVLGAGGMGLVLRAKHRFTGGTVAIKVLRTELSSDPDIQHRFLAEAQAPNAIGHPGIVRVVDAGRDATGLLFLAMELLEGRSLRIPMARGELSPAESRRIMLELLDALAAAHTRGFVHRDLKPDNVFLVAPNAATKLLDFGIAKVLDAGMARVRTATGITLGTPAYMAPEQLSDASSVDARADLWAAGVIIYEMLTGRLPFPGTTPDQLFVAIATKEPDPIRAHLPQAPPQLEAFFARALARDPRMRFGAAIEMAHALSALPLEPARPARSSVPPMITPPASYAGAATAAAHTPAPSAGYIPPPHTPPPSAAYVPAPQAPPPTAHGAPMPTQTARVAAKPKKSPMTLIVSLAAAAAVAVLVVLLVTRGSENGDTTTAAKPTTGSAAPSTAGSSAPEVVAEAPKPAVATPKPAVVDDAPKSRMERIAAGDIFAPDPKPTTPTQPKQPRPVPKMPTVATPATTAPAPASGAPTCEQSCKAVARCGFPSPTCVADCASDPAGKPCIDRAITDCNGLARCLFAAVCNGVEPTGTSSCQQAAVCQGSCTEDITCICQCASRMAPKHALALLRLDLCVAKCGESESCVEQSCTQLANACAAR